MALDGVVGDRAGDAENVGVARAAFQAHAQLLGVVTRREAGHQSQCRSRCNCPSSCERAMGCGGGSSTSIDSRDSWSPSKQHLQRVRPDAASQQQHHQHNDHGLQQERLLIRCGGDGGGLRFTCAGPHQTRVKANVYAISAKIEERMKTAASGQPICRAVS